MIYRVGELVGDELPHQSDGRRSLLSDLQTQQFERVDTDVTGC